MLDSKKAPQTAGDDPQGTTNTTNSIADAKDLVNPKEKCKYWAAVAYPENMVPDWEERAGDIVQGLPLSYCMHDLSHDTESKERKDHVHFLIAFPNTTTYKAALGIFKGFSAPGRRAVNKVEGVYHIRGAYNYLIHDTDACRKAGKELYPAERRVLVNDFDIGLFEQVSVADKRAAGRDLAKIVVEQGFINFTDLYQYVLTEHTENDLFFEVLLTYSGFFERLTKGNYLRMQVKDSNGVLLPR